MSGAIVVIMQLMEQHRKAEEERRAAMPGTDDELWAENYEKKTLIKQENDRIAKAKESHEKARMEAVEFGKRLGLDMEVCVGRDSYLSDFNNQEAGWPTHLISAVSKDPMCMPLKEYRNNKPGFYGHSILDGRSMTDIEAVTCEACFDRVREALSSKR